MSRALAITQVINRTINSERIIRSRPPSPYPHPHPHPHPPPPPNIDTKYLVSCIYRPPSATLEYYERIVDMFACARMTEYPVISLGDLNFNYILDETLSTNPIHYIETAYDMHQLIDQPTQVDDKTSSVLDIILTSHPALHRKSAVLKNTLSDHYLIYTYRIWKY